MNITLSQMLNDNGSRTPYPNELLYCEASSGLMNAAADAYASGPRENRKFDEKAFAYLMNNLSGYGCRDIQPASPQGEEVLFHVSRKGNRGTSASVFFCIYAVPDRSFAPGGTGTTSVWKVTYFQAQHSGKVQLKINNGQDLYTVDESKLSVVFGGQRYALIYRIVGIGCHKDSTTYQMLYQDKAVLTEPEVSL